MDIEDLVIPEAGQQFKGNDFRDLCKPGVYIFMKNGKPLYVGMSDALIHRAAAKNHRQAVRSRAECDKVLLYPCLSIAAAKQLETLLISRLHPPSNENSKRTLLRKSLGLKRNPQLM